MSQWKRFSYREFYDVPRAVVVLGNHEILLLTSRFDEAADEYSDEYEMLALPLETDLSGSWEGLERGAVRRLGSVRVSAVSFDASKRGEIDVDSLPLAGSFEF